MNTPASMPAGVWKVAVFRAHRLGACTACARIRRLAAYDGASRVATGAFETLNPYDLATREKLIAALDEGMTLRAAARLYQVDPSTVSRWRKRLERQGNLSASPSHGRQALLRGYDAWLADYVILHPDATPTDVHAALLRTGAKASYATVRRFMIRQGLATPAARPSRRRLAAPGP